MKMSSRDKVLALFLPGMVVVMVYGIFFFGPKQRELNRALSSLDDARTKAPGVNNQILQTQTKLLQMTQEQKRFETGMKQAQAGWEASGGMVVDGRQRNSRVDRLNSLLKRRGLSLIEDVEADGASSNNDYKLPPALDNLYKAAPNAVTGPKPQLRKIRMIGRYLDLLAALEDLSSSDLVAIPLSVTMKQASLKSLYREWTLFVWI